MEDTMDSFGRKPRSRFHRQHFSAGQSNSELHHFEKPKFYVAMRTQNPCSKLTATFKSHSCWQYQKGRCYHGEQCHFAHAIRGSCNPSSSGLHPVRNGHSDNRNCNVGKIIRCRWFSNRKICPYGDKCQFFHGCYGVEHKRLNTVEDHERGIFQKMKLCNTWEKFGNCPYGVKCIFAHGNAELKKISSHEVPIHGYTSSRLKLRTSQPKDEDTIFDRTFETARKVQFEGKTPFMKWNIEKISRVYADWMDSTNSLLVL